MTDTALALLYSPFPEMESAQAAAQALVEARLVACCNILPGMRSLYWWEGAVTESAEVVLLAKTTFAHVLAVKTRLAALHPYDTPAILTLTADAVPAFAAWVRAETGPIG